MSLNASGKFNLAVFGVILLAFTTEHQFQSVFGNNPIKKLSHNNFSVCLGTQPAGISTHGCIGHGFGLQANVVEETRP